MCDYSLHDVKSRPAKLKDRLVSTTFSNAITRGFAALGEPNIAVCLLPGTEVAFESNVECARAWGLLPYRRLASRVARFRQINTVKPSRHHDALEFPDGQVVLVHDLREGQRATVLQLPVTPQPARGEVERTKSPAASDH